MAEDPDGIVNWLRLSPEITTSGKLVKGDVARLSAIGVRHVINLAMGDSPDGLVDEDELLRGAGIAYTHIPVPFEDPREEHYSAFCAALDAAERPLHVHCIMNYRVSAFFYRWHRDHGGMAEADARALMEGLWKPGESDNPVMQTWARFITR